MVNEPEKPSRRPETAEQFRRRFRRQVARMRETERAIRAKRSKPGLRSDIQQEYAEGREKLLSEAMPGGRSHLYAAVTALAWALKEVEFTLEDGDIVDPEQAAELGTFVVQVKEILASARREGVWETREILLIQQLLKDAADHIAKTVWPHAECPESAPLAEALVRLCDFCRLAIGDQLTRSWKIQSLCRPFEWDEASREEFERFCHAHPLELTWRQPSLNAALQRRRRS